MTLRHALVRREGRSSGTMSIQSGLRKLGELVDLAARALAPARPKTFDELGEQVTGHGFTPR